ncbi:tetratricopeptide repeat protein [Candidatus Venteria ishoeyi]|uniref:tetratricopeptide repeat protein n=1 Tax=Candidatus Venteria ishoeyi TaxID=1899563 RepID=UPI0015AFF86A|nr:tetratricopeptide repeat protein [Candidatus Venteria ishoeyi]
MGLGVNDQLVDSLLTEIRSESNSRKKLDLYLEISHRYKKEDIDKANAAINKAINIAIQDDYPYKLAQVYFRKAELAQQDEKLSQAIEYYLKANSIFELLKDEENLSEGQKRIASLFEARGELNQALDYLLKSLSFYESSGDFKNQASITILIGKLYRNIGDEQLALDYFSLALVSVEKTKDEETHAFVANNLGLINEAQRNNNQALEFYYLALRKYKAIGDEVSRAQVLQNIGALNFKIGEFNDALNYFTNALAVNRLEQNRQNQALNYLWIGRCFIQTKNSDQAKQNLLASLELAQDIGLVIIERDAAEMLSDIYSEEGEFKKAFEMQQLYNEMYNKVSSEKNIKERAGIELKYQFEKKQKEKDVEAMSKSERQLFLVHILLAALIIVLLLVFLIGRIYILKRKANIELSTKNNIIKKSFDDIKSLSDIGKNISAKLVVEDIVSTVYESLRNLLDTDAFAIGIFNSEKKCLDFNGTIENGQVLPYFNYNLSNSDHLASLCFNSQKEIIIYDYLEESKKYLNDIPKPQAGEILESIIYLPLNYQDKKIGVITVQSFRKNAYIKSHINYLQNLAVYVAIALENARVYSQLEVQNKFNILLKNTIPNPMYLKNCKGYYLDCNPAFLQFIEKTREEVIGRTVFDVAPFELADVYKNKDEELLKDKKLQVYQSQVKLRDESLRDVRFFKDILWTDNNEVGGILGVILDITEFKRSEEQLIVFKQLAEASGQGFLYC